MRLTDYVYNPNGANSDITFELVRSTYHDQFSNVSTGWWGDSDKFEVLNAARDSQPRGAILFRTAPDYENPTDRRLQFRKYAPLRNFWLPHLGREQGPLRLRSWDRDNQYWLSVRATITDAEGRKHSSILTIPVTVRKTDKVPPVFTNSAPTAVWVTENYRRVTEIITGRHITDPADPAGHSPRTFTFAIDQNWGDGNKFDVGTGGSSNIINFRTAPDYENPTDVRITELRAGTTHVVSSAGNNVYWLEITASATDRDGGVHTAKHRMGVVVSNEWDTPPQKPLNLRQTGVGSGAGEAGRTVTFEWDQSISANWDDAPWKYEVSVFSWSPYRKVQTTHFNIPNPKTFWRLLRTRSFSHQVVLPNNGIFHVEVKPQNRVDGTPADKTLAVTNGVNTPPAFGSTTSFSNPENSTPNLNPSATDADPEDEVVSYALNATFGDAALFQINASTGALSFRQAPNYENPISAAGNNVYVVKVRATSRVPDTYQTFPVNYRPTPNRTLTTEATMTVTVTDVAERPGTPAAPTVAVLSQLDANDRNKLFVRWRAPSNPGPPINDYDVQYRDTAQLPFTGNGNAVAFAGANTSLIYTRPNGNPNYQFRIKAKSPEGESTWSNWGSGFINTPPVITSAATASAAENTSTTLLTVTATDADATDTQRSYAITGGVDAAAFTLDSTSGALKFTNAPNFENPTDRASTSPNNAANNNVYLVQVTATTGQAPRLAAASQLITVTVTDATEPPGTPAAPTVTGSSANGALAMNVTWTAPSNTGPPINDYDVRYRIRVTSGNPNAWTDAGHTGTTLSTTISPVTGTIYEVQVRAKNAEGTSSYSASTTESLNSSPRYTSASSFTVPENSASPYRIGQITAVDDDPLDQVEFIRIVGGADNDLFTLLSNGVLQWKSSPDYENPIDVVSTTGQPTATARDNMYSIVVRATSEGLSTAGLTVGELKSRTRRTDQTITIRVTDVDEPPGAITDLDLRLNFRSSTQVYMYWKPPEMTGKPPITGYDMRLRKHGTTGAWTSTAFPIATPSEGEVFTAGKVFDLFNGYKRVLTDLIKSVTNEVQVRAKNDEGTGPWVSATIKANALPVSTPTSFTVPENQRSVGTFTATDSDPGDTQFRFNIAVFAASEDRGKFTLDPQGNLQTKAASGFDYENPASAAGTNTYTFVLQTRSSNDFTLNPDTRLRLYEQIITVTVTDVDERLGKPNAPDVNAVVGSNSKLDVSWVAPSNTGPAIRYYNLRYRKGTTGDFTELNATILAGTTSHQLTGLEASSTYEVQVRATNGEGTGPWSDSGTGDTNAINTEALVQNPSPRFTSAASFSVAENQTSVGTVTAVDDDAQDSVTGYTLGGTDASKFQITSGGVLTFKTAPDYETPGSSSRDNLYLITVTASSGAGQRARQANQVVSVSVTDVPVPSSSAPTVTPASATSLTVTWSAASTTTGYPITDYDVRYRPTNPVGAVSNLASTWTELTHTGTGQTATISSLSSNVSYQVQVRATNSEGVGPWSAAGTGATNSPPVVTVNKLYTVVENTAPTTAIATFTATDVDTQDGTPTLVLDGGDKSQFTLSSGVLTFKVAPNFERPADVANFSPAATEDQSEAGNNEYSLRLKASSGSGGRLKSTYSPWFKVQVTNVPSPAKPAAPTVTPDAAVPTRLTVTWTAPSTTSGYPITDYDVQYRAGTTGSYTDGRHIGTAKTRLLQYLTAGTSYQVRVRATSSEGTSPWSDAGTGSTSSNAAPVFSSTTFSVVEGISAVGTVVATDADTSDTARQYTIEGGADSAKFTIVENGENAGNLTFVAAPDFENPTDVAHTTPAPADAAANNTYVLVIDAISGTGERAARTRERVTVTVTDKNEPPVLSPVTLTPVAENTRAVATVSATDPDKTTGGVLRDAITYALSGADSGKFQITSPGGVLTFRAAPNYENPTDVASTGSVVNPAGNNQYIVEVTATSAAGTARALSSQSRTLIVRVSDANEPPIAPASPTVAAVDNYADKLDVTWTAPTNTGKPPIQHYHVRYKKEDASSFTLHSSEIAPDTTKLTTKLRLTGLTPGKTYQVQVRADNAEGEGTWSASGEGTTNGIRIVLPRFANSAAKVSHSVAENSTAVTTVVATDATGVVVTFSIPATDVAGGVDRGKFEITTGGVLTFSTAPDYENPQDVESTTPANAAGNNEYIVWVQATGRATALQMLTVTVTDVAEKPGKPAAPGVTAATATPTKLSVTWTAPTNTGPAITDYDVQYRTGGTPVGTWQDAGFSGTGTSTTLTGLTQGTAYEVQVRATSNEGTGPWSASGSRSTARNVASSFSITTFSVAENIKAVGRVTATDSDTDDNVTRYQIAGGADSAKFSITETGTNSGKLAFSTAPDYEANASAAGNNTYKVQITATSGTGERVLTSAEQTFTITVTDASEPPIAPAAPTVTSIPATPTSLSVSWTAPTNTGKPAITGYRLRYRKGSTGGFTLVAGTFTSSPATLSGLTKGTSYQVQVRATNAEGDGPWSASGSGSTAGNAQPSFSTTSFSVAENTKAVGTVTATDSDASDSVTSYAITGGADETKFSITETGANKGKLAFINAPDFEANGSAAGNNAYKVEITATSGAGARQSTKAATFTITVTDVNEAPAKPAAPTVAGIPAQPTQLSVSWTAPTNTGKPAITGYQLQYRKGSTGSFTLASGTVTGTSTTLRGLTQGTAYQVQVRAKNAEGDSPWSASGSGSTARNVQPSFSTTSFSVAENTKAVGTVTATDSDASDSITRYAITGGADSAKFSITETGANKGKLVFDAAPDYEANGSAAGNNAYKVEITATSGTSARQTTKAQVITVNVTNVTEKPLVPTGLRVTATTLSSLTAGWSAPNNSGRPALSGYDVQYRQGSSGVWTAVTHTGVSTTTTITSLTPNTSYQMRVRAENSDGEGAWTSPVTGTTSVDTAPSFTSAASFSLAENTKTVGTVSATDSDAGDSITGYQVTGGVDSAKFSISNAGALSFKAAPDYENPTDKASTSPTNAARNNVYIVEVSATGGVGSRSLTTAQRIAVTVTDANEPPSAPGAPTVAAVDNYADKLDVTWTAPTNTGKPPIQHYHVRYKKEDASSFTLHSSEVAAGTTNLRLTGLSAGTAYQVQVRADNAEGEGPWSASGEGTTNSHSALLPQFSNNLAEASHSVAENSTAVTTVVATDATGVAVTFSIPATDAAGGVDRAKFAITSGGVLTFSTAPNYENPQDVQSTTPANAAGNNEYIVKVQATGRATATQTLTVTVTDVAEKPGKPAAPGVTAATASPTSLSVTWTAPTNTGPAIIDYDVRYRTGGTPAGTWQDAGFSGTGTSTTLTGLTQGTAYDVQVRATSNEGTGPWSDSGSRSTATNVQPSFSTTSFSVAENTKAVGTVTATDSDATDNVTRYAITGGADETKFSITETGANKGKLVFDAAPNYEANGSAAGNNAYKVQITATSGTSARQTTKAATFTITVTDVNEPPVKPAAPTVAGIPATPTSLSVSWTAPTNTGKPAITGYQLQYRKGTSGSFTLAAGTVTGTSTTLRGLTKGTAYQVQVRAKNAEGDSPWSAAGSGSTATNAQPSFSTTSFSVVENTKAVGTVTATDSDASDSVTRYAITGGADETKFSITETGANKGKLAFITAPDFEATASAAGNNAYKVEITATSGAGARQATKAQVITVNVTDANEPPSAPSAPTVTAVSGWPGRLNVTWAAPTNTGKPPIQHYHVRYGVDGNSVTFTEKTGTADEITSPRTLLTGLNAGAAYQVQVRADNAEGEGPWSASGEGTTNSDSALLPQFSGSVTTYDVAENTTAVATLTATDATNAPITFSIPATDATGGVDRAKFSITSLGVLTFSTAPDYENPGDVQSPAPNTSAAGDNEYIVIVRAASSRGQRDRPLIVRVTDVNEAPAFSTGSAFSVPENTTAVTTVTAADPDKNSDGITARDGITYTKEGTDAGLFTIDSSTGVLSFTAAPNYEVPGDSESTSPANAARNNVYVLTVKATSGQGTRVMSAKLPLVVTVTDKAEAPKKPNAPTVTAVSNSVTKLDVSWSAPDNTGPNISGYNVQYRKDSATGAFTSVSGDITTTSTRLTGLEANTRYDVQVRAKNAEGTGPWSDSGEGTTNDYSVLRAGAGNSRPRFTTASSFNVVENSTAVGTVAAVDDDGQDEVTRYALTGGADNAKFTITETGTGMGKLVFDAAPDYEATASSTGTNAYKVEVTATSGGTGDRRLTQAQTLTITVTDANEPPNAPTGVTVNNATATPMQLDVSWTAPTVPSSIPALSGYDVQYRQGTSGSWLTFSHTGTGTTAAITGLTAGASYQVQVRAKNSEGTSAWAQGSGTTAGNAQPSFSSTSFSVAENTKAVGTVTATDSDASDSVTRYAITGGADETKFSITETGANMGKLAFSTAPDYEANASAAGNNAYKVQITATSGSGARQATKAATFTITVTDVNEPPVKPAAPTVTGISEYPERLKVTWTAPANAGKPAITGYQLQYRKGTSGTFTLAAGTVTGTSTTLHNLTQGTAYQAQVRAKNAEGDSPWSDAGSGSTAANAEVQFASTRTGSLDENSSTTANILTLDATDADTGDSISYAITGGADSGAFTIEDTDKLRFTTSPDHENPTDVLSASPTNGAANNEYIVEVTATSGSGARASTAAQTLTITVNDVDEPPIAPAAPSVSGTTLTTLKVTWTAPSNSGKPAIDDYDVQYRKSGASWQSKPHAGTGTSTTLTGLTTGTTYQVQVQAKNDEGNSPWSASGTGTTVVNSGPAFTTAAAQTIAENDTEIVTLAATDADASDTITGYELAGGADETLFKIDSESETVHKLLFKNAPNYEAPGDAASNNRYIVIVKVTSGAPGDIGETRKLSATRTFTVTVTDVAEAPGKPDAPTLSTKPNVGGTSGPDNLLKVAWTAPANSGPPISGYDVQYRQTTVGAVSNRAYTDANHTGTTTEMTLTGLASSTTYQVQVRAKNEEGTGPWSDLGRARTPPDEGENTPPRFMSQAQVDVRENTMPVVTLVAIDDDEQDAIMGYEITGGIDEGAFTIRNDDELRFKKAQDYENPGDAASIEPVNAARNNECLVEVMVTSGEGARKRTVKLMVLVRVTDVSGPERPAAPKVSSVSGSTTKLRVKWRAPVGGTSGPDSLPLSDYPINDYDVQYRAVDAGAWKNAKYDGTGTTTDLTGLAAEETYLVQVRARSSEGISPWSPEGIGSPSGPPIADAPTDTDPGEEGELPPDGAPAVPVIIEHKTVVINEIGNRSEDKYDWVELFNRAYKDISLKDWSLSLVAKSVVHDVAKDALESGDGSMHDVQLVHFKTDITIPARGYLLVMHSEPQAKAHPLAGGIALATPPEKPLPGQKPLTPSLPLSQCYVDTGLSLPDGDFLLILRDSATAEGTDEHLRDVAGNYYKGGMVGAEPTLMWPLILDVRDVSNFNFRSDEVWARDNTRIDGFCENAFVQAPYTGVGYDRAIAPTDAGGKHSGTPGYANDALKTTAAELADASCISISEVMFATSAVAQEPANALRTTENLPQWIEVFNCSESEAVSLENWRLEIRNRRDGGARPKTTLIFNQALLIPPRQTVLLLSSTERAIKPRAVGRGLVSSEPWPASGHLPEAYVYSLYDEAAAQLQMTSRNDKVLSPDGFTLTLKDMADQVVDVIGNHVEGEPVAWQLPVSKSETGARSSMLRRYVDGDAVDGRKAEAWVSAAETHLSAVQNGLYYGDATDISTPGYRGSMLSTFEMTATGTSIELTWQTASEANTAGFYVLRCDTRDGEFVTCNDSLITGAGTTSTPRTYAYTDTKKTAGVAYWYRLEEESFAGVRQILAKRQLAFAKADVNGDGEINVKDLVFAAAGNGQPAPRAKKQNPDVNGDGIVNPRDVQAVLGVLEAKPGAAPMHPQLTANLLQPWIDKAKQLNLPDATFQRGIRELERLATAMTIPKETALLPNYPNPFNPETWIPYELAEAASVTLTFYDMRGRVVRTLALGHRPAGVYRTKARAAYWDGRNAQGERVASGVYFYTMSTDLGAGDFTATGKLVVRK